MTVNNEIKEKFVSFLRELSDELGLPENYIVRVIVNAYLKGEIEIQPMPKFVLRGGTLEHRKEERRERVSIWEYVRP